MCDTPLDSSQKDEKNEYRIDGVTVVLNFNIIIKIIEKCVKYSLLRKRDCIFKYKHETWYTCSIDLGQHFLGVDESYLSVSSNNRIIYAN